MKTNLLKTFTTLAVMATMSFSTVLFAADEVALPVISKPAVLQEGIQKDLSAAQIAELLPWAKNSKIFLIDLLDNVQSLPSRDKNERLVEGIKSTVSESAPKNSELLMRYALNRGLVISEILSKEMNADEVGSSDVQSRVLVASVQMAIKSYDADLSTMTKKTNPSFAAFGIEYYNFLAELNKSVIDASAQYAIQKTALEWLQWDLYRDLNNTAYAPQIVKINNALKIFPNKKMTDAQSLNYIRQMKKLSGQLNLYVKSMKGTTTTDGTNSIKEVLEVGDAVIYSYDNNSGVVAGVRDGKYTIKFDNGAYVSDITRKYLFQKFGCNDTFCVGEDSFYTYSNMHGQIEAVYGENVFIRLVSSEIVQSGPNHVAKLTGCKGGYCAGDKVVYTYSNTPGVVTGHLPKGLILIRLNDDSSSVVTASPSYVIKDGL